MATKAHKLAGISIDELLAFPVGEAKAAAARDWPQADELPRTRIAMHALAEALA